LDLYNLVGRISLQGFNNISPQLTQINNQFTQLNVKINQTTQKTQSFTQNISAYASNLGSRLQSIGAGLTSVGTKLTASVTLPILGIGAAAIKVGMDFEAGMAKVQAMAGVSAKDMEKLSDKAKEMGIKTKFSAKEAADALYYLASAGWKTQEMLGGLEGIMNLAAASGEDLASTSNYVVGSMKALGLQANESARFADVLAKAASNSNTNVAQMGEAFKAGAGTAGMLKYKLEDVSLAMGLMANSNIKGSQAGRLFSTGLLRMVSPTDDVALAMKKLNINMTDASGQMIPLNKLIDNIRSSFSKLTPAQQASNASIIFGKNAIKAWQAIINATPEDVEKLTKAIANSGGAAQKMADIQLATLSGRITLIKSSLEGLGIKLYETFNNNDVIKKMANVVLDLVNKFAALPKSTLTIISVFAGLLAAIGPIVTIIGMAITGVAGLAFAFSAIITPVGLIATAISILIGAGALGGLVALLAGLKFANMDQLADAFNSIKDKAIEVYSYLKEQWIPAIKFILSGDKKELAKVDDKNFQESLENTRKSLETLGKKINEFVDGIANTFSSLNNQNLDDFSTSVANAVTDISNAASTILDIIQTIKDAYDAIKRFQLELRVSAGKIDSFFGFDKIDTSNAKMAAKAALDLLDMDIQKLFAEKKKYTREYEMATTVKGKEEAQKKIDEANKDLDSKIKELSKEEKSYNKKYKTTLDIDSSYASQQIESNNRLLETQIKKELKGNKIIEVDGSIKDEKVRNQIEKHNEEIKLKIASGHISETEKVTINANVNTEPAKSSVNKGHDDVKTTANSNNIVNTTKKVNINANTDTKKAKESVTSAFSVLSSFIDSIKLPSFTKSVSIGINTIIKGITGKARGGPAEGLTLVGEEGPELLALPKGSYVYNNGDTRSILAGKQVRQADGINSNGNNNTVINNYLNINFDDINDVVKLKNFLNQIKSESVARGGAS
jgi:TP901 family phage tail tape measure protein